MVLFLNYKTLYWLFSFEEHNHFFAGLIVTPRFSDAEDLSEKRWEQEVYYFVFKQKFFSGKGRFD